VSGVGGQLKSAGLEAPFVGREREFKLIKELFYDYAAERKAHLVSVTGIAGIGKARLAWEFYKYFDGIVEQVYWQRGRCLAYGEGVAYWPWRTWSGCVAGSRRTRSPPPRDPSFRPPWRSISSIQRSGRSSSRDWRICWDWTRRPRVTGRICSRPGGCSSSGWPTPTRRCSPSRTCSGRTRACSTSSSTYSSGRAITRST